MNAQYLLFTLDFVESNYYLTFTLDFVVVKVELLFNLTRRKTNEKNCIALEMAKKKKNKKHTPDLSLGFSVAPTSHIF